MLYMIFAAAYAVIVVGGIRFFQTVRRWDEEARLLMERHVRNRQRARRRVTPLSAHTAM